MATDQPEYAGGSGALLSTGAVRFPISQTLLRLPLLPGGAGGLALRAQVAQLVEQRTENPRVGGSIPPLGTILFKDLCSMALFKFVLR